MHIGDCLFQTEATHSSFRDAKKHKVDEEMINAINLFQGQSTVTGAKIK